MTEVTLCIPQFHPCLGATKVWVIVQELGHYPKTLMHFLALIPIPKAHSGATISNYIKI